MVPGVGAGQLAPTPPSQGGYTHRASRQKLARPESPNAQLESDLLFTLAVPYGSQSPCSFHPGDTMTHHRAPTDRAQRRIPWQKKLAATALAGALLVGTLAGSTATGAWFTSSRTVANNSAASSTLGGVTNFTAKKSASGVNLSWSSALQQPWATSNSITTEPVYTITRTRDGQTTTLSTNTTSNTYTDSYPPATRVRARSLAVGYDSAGYVRSDGTVWVWGYNRYGLGTGRTTANTPAKIVFDSGASADGISMYGNTGVVTLSDGKFYAWGLNANGDCDGYSSTSSYARQQFLPGNVTARDAVAAGTCTTIALDYDNTIWQRGGSANSGKFQASSRYYYAINLPGGRTVKQLTRAETVLASDGTVWSWGLNDKGQFGDGTTTASTTPVQAQLPSGVVISRLSADGRSVVAVTSTGTIYAWGDNTLGQLATGSVGGYVTTPRIMNLPGDHIWEDAQTTSLTTTIMAADDKSLWSVGKGSEGNLGYGGRTDSSSAFIRTGASTNATPKMIATGWNQNYFLDTSGNLWGWGKATDRTSSFFGNDDISSTYYLSPKVVQSPVDVISGSRSVYCDSGNLTLWEYCAPAGTTTYSITYAVKSWISPVAQAAAQ